MRSPERGRTSRSRDLGTRAALGFGANLTFYLGQLQQQLLELEVVLIRRDGRLAGAEVVDRGFELCAAFHQTCQLRVSSRDDHLWREVRQLRNGAVASGIVGLAAHAV